MMMEDTCHKLSQTVMEQPLQSKQLKSLVNNIVEVSHMLLITAREAAESEDVEEIEHIYMMTQDKGKLTEGLRKNYMSAEVDVTAKDRATILFATDLYQRLVWLIHKWAELQKASLRIEYK